MLLSIDEAISKQRKIAETQRLLYEACILKEQNTHFLRQAEEHEQIAEWLEELKVYRSLKKSNFLSGYNKAIDDFAEHIRVYYALKQEMGYVATTYEDLIKFIFELAEQLKAGVDNDNR